MQARKIISDLKYFAKDFNEILYFPKREIASYDYIVESKECQPVLIGFEWKILGKWGVFICD